MKRFLLMAATAVAVVLAAPGPAHAVDKVTICHATGNGSYVTLTIPRQAAFGQAGHFYENGTTRAGHEDDYLGPCRTPDTTTTTTTTTTSTTTSTTIPDDSTTSSSTTIPDDSTPDRVTTTTIIIDDCGALGSCPDEETTTTEPVTTSTLADGGNGTTTGLSIAGLLSMMLGAGALLTARRS